MARLEAQATRAFLKHLGRARISHYPEQKWASAREHPGKKSIFGPLKEQGGSTNEDAGLSESTQPSRLAKEEPALQMEPVLESISHCELSHSKQVEVLDLQGFSRVGSGVSKAKAEEAGPSGSPESTSLETSALGCSESPLEGHQVQAGGGQEGLPEPQEVVLGQDAEAEVRLAKLAQDPASNLPQKTLSSSRITPKGSLGKWKRGSPAMYRGWMDLRPLDASEKAAAARLGFCWYPYYNTEGGNRRGTVKAERRAGNGRPRVKSASLEKRGDSKCVASRRDKSVHENQGLSEFQAQKRKSTLSLSEGEAANEHRGKETRAVPKAPFRMEEKRREEEKKPEEKEPDEAPGSGPFFYLGGANGVDILNVYCKSKGWQRIYDNRREDFILKWCETKFRDTYYNFREGEQLLYQIPNNKLLTTKIGLLMNLREYERVIKKMNRATKTLRMEEFFPETFRLDTKDERESFFESYTEPQIWICKPTSSNQGRGIFLLKNQAEVNDLEAKLHSLEEDAQYKRLPYKIPPARIVQRYVDKPLLLEGKKFDVRSYLLIACTVPYMLFFGHGYVRLTCLNYDPRSEDLTSHLTNQYVQKKSPIYALVKEETVWQMDRFNQYVNEKFRQAKGLPKDWVFNGFTKRMKEIMLQCFLAVKSKLDCKLGYFDLIGCDFLIDEDFKVWLLEMNANPALHTNCGALKNIVPTVVNETLDLTIEIFTKIQKAQHILPLESLCHFALLYNGLASDNGPPHLTKSRTSLRSLRSHWAQAGSSRATDKQPAKSLEKPPRGEASGPSEGLSLPPSKGVPQNTLPMPQIQISIVPGVSCCQSVKAVLRGNHVCSSSNQYIIRHVPAASDKHESAHDRGTASGSAAAGGNAKDRPYAACFQRMFRSKMQPPSGNEADGPLTSSQMVSLHLQSNLPPNLPASQEAFKPLHQLMTHRKTPADDGKDAAEILRQSCGESIPEDTKVAYRGS